MKNQQSKWTWQDFVLGWNIYYWYKEHKTFLSETKENERLREELKKEHAALQKSIEQRRAKITLLKETDPVRAKVLSNELDAEIVIMIDKLLKPNNQQLRSK